MLLSLGVRINQAGNEVQEFVCFHGVFAIEFTIVLNFQNKVNRSNNSLHSFR